MGLNLANIIFYDDNGAAYAPGALVIPYGNQFELLPNEPEPGTWALLLAGGAATLAAGGCRRRRPA